MGKLFLGARQARYLFPVPVSILLVLMFFVAGAFVGLLMMPIFSVTINWLFSQLATHFNVVEQVSSDVKIMGFLFSTIGTIALVVCWVKLIEDRPVRSLGFFKKHAFRKLVIGWTWGGFLFGSVVFLLWLFGFAVFTQAHFNGYTFVVFLFYAILWQIQGSSEEMVMRGWMLPVVSSRANRWLGMGLSSVIFGVLHIFNSGISWIPTLNICLFGLAMAIYAIKEDDIWGVCGLHAAWNCFQGSGFGLPVSGNEIPSSLIRMTTSGPDWLSGGEFGPEGSLFTSAILLLFIIYLLMMKRIQLK